MKSFLCSIFGIHRWNGCKCQRCGEVRPLHHAFDGCVCTVCGGVEHSFSGMRGDACKRCGVPCPPCDHEWVDDYMDMAGGSSVSMVYIGMRCIHCGGKKDEDD